MIYTFIYFLGGLLATEAHKDALFQLKTAFWGSMTGFTMNPKVILKKSHLDQKSPKNHFSAILGVSSFLDPPQDIVWTFWISEE